MDRQAWAIVLQLGASMVYTAFLVWLIYLLAHDKLDDTVRFIFGNFGYGFLALLAIPTLSYGVGSWLGRIKVKGSATGLEFDAGREDLPNARTEEVAPSLRQEEPKDEPTTE